MPIVMMFLVLKTLVLILVDSDKMYSVAKIDGASLLYLVYDVGNKIFDRIL